VSREYEVHGIAVPETLHLLHELLARVTREHPELSGDDLMLFETAVIEIAGNVVEHGEPQGEVTWSFRFHVLPDRIEAHLVDAGQEVPGAAPPEAPDEWSEGGRGLLVAQAALDDLTYRRRDGQNIWRMTRLRRSA
jgi:serine/threonine-protein kinase RsbW